MGTDLFFDFSLQYEPFGPLKGLTYGNGINETRSYDLAGRLSGITTPGKQSQTFGYRGKWGQIYFLTSAFSTSPSAR